MAFSHCTVPMETPKYAPKGRAVTKCVYAGKPRRCYEFGNRKEEDCHVGIELELFEHKKTKSAPQINSATNRHGEHWRERRVTVMQR